MAMAAINMVSAVRVFSTVFDISEIRLHKIPLGLLALLRFHVNESRLRPDISASPNK